jgi:isoquinoline 1-oxidoreductase alpha subunit
MSDGRHVFEDFLKEGGSLGEAMLDECRRDPRQAITASGVACLICGRFFRHLTNTHLQKHGLTSDEYKEQFGYNRRRALMVPASRQTHSNNSREAGLADRIQRRRIFESAESKRRGGQHTHRLEELLTRRDRLSKFPTRSTSTRDDQGRFVAAALTGHRLLQSGDRAWKGFRFTINGTALEVENVPADMPLLWILRDVLNLKGTKFGCGIGACGACTVHINGVARRACQVPVSTVGEQQVTTIEGLSVQGSHPLQKAWMELDVPQCGYCQAGQIMSAAALLSNNPDPTDDEINAAMDGNICRCGTYLRIRQAIHLAAEYSTETDEASV